MTPSRWALSMFALSVCAVRCGEAPPAPAQASKLPTELQASVAVAPPKPPTPALLPRAAQPGPALAPSVYEAKGRRDPFAPVVTSKEETGLDVSTTKLVGVIQGHQLLALVESLDGHGYILKTGDVLGNGRITDVTLNSITFAVVAPASQRDTSLTLRLVRE
ncbi:MAG: hypothetical protein C5B48_11990 [Candidatus Rokuibacteriota bacterium]|nr:MAG: hypothetical protein C5B48_11990 [Candidatus Rokubacteria bacterium]